MRQIFILERDEFNLLRSGEALKIVLGDQTILLQADVRRAHVKTATSNGKRPYHRRNESHTVGDRLIEYLRIHGAKRAVELADGLGVPRSAVASALARFRGISVRRSGKQHNAVWRIK